MASGTWARSGRRPAAGRSAGARPEGSLAVAVARARGVWDGLTGGPDAPAPVGGPGCGCYPPGAVVAIRDGEALGHAAECVAGAGFYSVEAAAAIVGLALALWADTARAMGEDGGDGGEG